MSIPKFNDCILSNNKFTNFCEKYLFVKGFSETLGYRQFEVLDEDHSVIQPSTSLIKPLDWEQKALSVIQVCSFIIFPLLALVALIGKEMNRKTHTYTILDQTPIPSHLNPVNSTQSSVPSSSLTLVNSSPGQVTKQVLKPTVPLVESQSPTQTASENKDPAKEKRYKEDLERVDAILNLGDKPIELPDVIPEILDYRGTKLMQASDLNKYGRLLSFKYPELFVANNFGYNVDQSTPGHPLIGESIEHDLRKKKIGDKKFLSYPLYVNNNHWTLVFIDREKRTIEYYDSMKNYGNQDNKIGNYFTEFAKVLSEKDPGEKPYTFISKINKHIQNDGYQCAPWSAYFLEKRLENPDIDFNRLDVTLDVNKAQDMIANFRKKMILGFMLMEGDKNPFRRDKKI